jgi:hypothetical protein
MGKACVRFKKLDDVALDVVGQAFRRISADAWIATYETSLAGNAQRKSAKKAVAKPGPKAKAGKPTKAAPTKKAAAAKPVRKAKKKATKAKAR